MINNELNGIYDYLCAKVQIIMLKRVSPSLNNVKKNKIVSDEKKGSRDWLPFPVFIFKTDQRTAFCVMMLDVKFISLPLSQSFHLSLRRRLSLVAGWN